MPDLRTGLELEAVPVGACVALVDADTEGSASSGLVLVVAVGTVLVLAGVFGLTPWVHATRVIPAKNGATAANANRRGDATLFGVWELSCIDLMLPV